MLSPNWLKIHQIKKLFSQQDLEEASFSVEKSYSGTSFPEEDGSIFTQERRCCLSRQNGKALNIETGKAIWIHSRM